MKERLGQAIRAIVVEDEEKIGRYIGNKIESLDASVSVAGLAANGAEALALIEKCRPQIVFTDISMPVMDGLELAKAIRYHYPGIAVVIISGYSEFSYAQQAIQYGVFNYILKPIEEEELADTLYDIRKSLAYGHLGEERQVIYSDTDMFRQTADMEYVIFSICAGNLIYDMQDAVLTGFYEEQMQKIPWRKIMEETCGDRFCWYLADEEPVNQRIAGIQFKKGASVSIDALAHTLCGNIGQYTDLAVHICSPKEAVPHEELWNTAKYLRHRLQQGLVVGYTQILTEDGEDSQGKSVFVCFKAAGIFRRRALRRAVFKGAADLAAAGNRACRVRGRSAFVHDKMFTGDQRVYEPCV